MSAAAVATPRIKRGDAVIPHSVIDNQAFFSNAEFRLAVLVCQHNGVQSFKGSGAPTAITETAWVSATGLTPRMLEHATKGLQSKGLEVVGRGNKARYFFKRETFEDFLRKQEPLTEKPATVVGRAPRKGAKVHPVCAESGCAMMRAGLDSALTPACTTNLAKPVSQNGGGRVSPAASVSTTGKNGLTLLPSTNLAKPVSRFTDAAEQVWAKTLAVLQALFPLVDAIFLVRLVAIVRTLFADVTDSELAEAVTMAWNAKKHTQQSEGLFLTTVPAALRALRKRPPQISGPPGLAEGVGGLLRQVGEALRARGGPFEEYAGRVDRLAAGLNNTTAEWEIVEQAMLSLESEIVAAVATQLDQAEVIRIQAAVEQMAAQWSSKLPAAAVDEIRLKTFAAEVLASASIPRLSAFYV